MSRRANKLTARKVEALTMPGRYGDGEGLWLQIGPEGGKSWLFRFTLNGRSRMMGLGPVNLISLAQAREIAFEQRKRLHAGIDPLSHRTAERLKGRLAESGAISFKVAATRYIAAHKSGWKNAKHAAQWANTLTTYAHQVIGDLSVKDLDTGLILKVLEPIWMDKPETATRLRGRIEAVIDWATARGYRQGENPARWKGHLDKLLPARTKVRSVKHHDAMSYADLPAFYEVLSDRDEVSARALAFTILTAARTSEVIGARWNEFDLQGRVWTVPAERMKAGREHRIPLSNSALNILRSLAREKDDVFVFPGGKANKPLSNMAMLALLKRMGLSDITVHGFRSSFRDWAAERTNYAREVAEQALAHTISDKVEAAYRRGDVFEKRRRLMRDWATFCATPTTPATSRNVSSR